MTQSSQSAAHDHAVPSVPAPSSPPSSTTRPTQAKLRSCVVCRSRKVRCDKLSPCTNCRRANIACVVPSADRPPRWARRLDRITNNGTTQATDTAGATTDGAASGSVSTVSSALQGPSQSASHPATQGETISGETDAAAVDQVMDRLRNLESLVRELSGQLELSKANSSASASAAASPATHDSPREKSKDASADSPMAGTARSHANTNTSDLQKHFGRLVVQGSNQTRYIGSGFWSRVSDEIDGLKMDAEVLAGNDSDTSDDEESLMENTPPSTQELDRTPAERHGFLFGHNLSGNVRKAMPEYSHLRPLPSQIPFLVDTFSENVNLVVQVAHPPTINQLVRDMRTAGASSLTPTDEALMFAIYYAAVTSMEEEDVMVNFNATKADLNLKYRIGLEQALAQADFLNNPNLVILQAFTIFLLLARRHDSPRFVWMMTGLAIRMAHAIGLHRDGSQFKDLSPYEVEMRRRIWWAICCIDARASEDQGTDFTIAYGSFDTKLPLHINNEDINPDGAQISDTPQERQSFADLSYAVFMYESAEITRSIMAPGVKEKRPSLEEQNALLDKLQSNLETGYAQYAPESQRVAYWITWTTTALVKAKLTLFIYLPTLFSPPSEHFSETTRNRLLVAAIEVAEYNHMLNARQDAKQWRWIYQTYTHWHAIVYLLIETCRRNWSPIVERAWIALHSRWLIPAQTGTDRSSTRIWVPLKRLMANAHKHRHSELRRLREVQSQEELEVLVNEDRNVPVPQSSCPLYPESSAAADPLLSHWWQLVRAAPNHGYEEQVQRSSPGKQQQEGANLEPSQSFAARPSWGPQPSDSYLSFTESGGGVTGSGAEASAREARESSPRDVARPALGSLGDWQNDQGGFVPWSWSPAHQNSTIDMSNLEDLDVNMDLDENFDWGTWLESAATLGGMR